LKMIREISDLRNRFDTTMLYVTHDHLEAMLVGHRVAVLSAGVLQQVAEPSVLYRRPANLFVAGFFGSPPMNLFPGRMSYAANGLTFRLQDSATFLGSSVGGKPPGLSELEPWLDKPVILGVRAEDIRCESMAIQGGGRAGFTSKVLALEQIGSDTFLRACWQGNSIVARVSRQSSWVVGQDSHFDWDLAEACYFDPATGKAILP
jgi:multiple sugar transport system ATP-binding protein